MKGRVLVSGLVAACFMLSTVEAQVAQLGRMPLKGKVKPAGLLGGLFPGKSGGCDGGCTGCADPSCGVADPSCGIAEPDCGVAGPTCGLAGVFLGGGSCGLPEPACGSTGLGYAGGFGLCGGSCDSCGSGSYFGRQLHQVNPCACGGSLVADLARGLLTLVDRAVGSVVGGICGGLQSVTCHASGTFAALHCATQASCDSCGGGGCDGGCAGFSSYGATTLDPSQQYAEPNSYPTMMSDDIYLPQPTPSADKAPATGETPMEEISPSQPTPIIQESMDPFLDDPDPTLRAMPQASRKRVAPVGRQSQQVRTATYQQRTAQSSRAVAAGRPAGQSVRAATANAAVPLNYHYLQGQHRGVTLRR